MFKYNVKDVLDHAYGRWIEIINALSVHNVSDTVTMGRKKHIDCPIHGGKRDFRAFNDVNETGGTICTCCNNPNGIETLKFLNSWSFKETITSIKDYLGLYEDDDETRKPAPKVRILHPKEETIKPKEYAIEQLQKLYQSSVSLSDPLAEPARAYFTKRKLSEFKFPDHEVRFVPDLHYWDEDNECSLGSYPGIISVIRSPEGIPLTLHRTYLDLDGRKAQVPKAKKIMSCVAEHALVKFGGAIRLSEVFGDTMGIAEGIETAVAGYLGTDIPTWASYSANLLEKFNPPLSVRYLVHWIDKDRSKRGDEASVRLSAACQLKNIIYIPARPSIAIPDGMKGVDWWDVFDQFGKDGFSQIRSFIQSTRSHYEKEQHTANQS